MSKVLDLIYEQDSPQQNIMLFLHKLLTEEYELTTKVTFNNPCYYKHSWICYLKPTKKATLELAFMRGNELSNTQGLLQSNGRKQLRSMEFSCIEDIPLALLKEILHEAVLLDQTIPYQSKRKSR